MEISSFLDDRPVGPGIRITDREKWDKFKSDRLSGGILKKAEDILKEPLPETTDDLYLDFTRNGNRTRWQDVNFKRRSRIKTLTLAECLEDKGRFTPALEKTIGEICREKTWVMPAHDRNLANFEGKIVEIDLASSMLGLDLAAAKFVLGDKLSVECRKTIDANLAKRIISPYKDMLSGKLNTWWLTGDSNWNAVCLGSVTATCLTVVESKEERAYYIAEALKYSRHYVSGFTDDGYCSEGVGYWNYGFGHYVILAESILKATHGKINLFNDSKVKSMSEFSRNIEIINGVCPAFADCDIKARPMSSLVKYISYRYGSTDNYDNFNFDSELFYCIAVSFPEKADPPDLPDEKEDRLRSWFDIAGILICRPAKDSSCRIGAALKGGNNAELHNHNDIGSYVIVQTKEPIILDPGGEVYTARTFSSKRYDSNLLNSFGHPVPVIAGQLQKTGKEACAKIISTEFTDKCDTFQMELSSAYDVKGLESLKRTFLYSRQGNGSLTVTDEVSMELPGSFETACVTAGTFEKKSESSIVVSSGKEKILVEFSSDAGEIEISSFEIKEEMNAKIKPLRIGFKLKNPVDKAYIKLKFSPL